MIKGFQSTFDYKLIYIFRINDDAHKGLVKIGDTTINTNQDLSTLAPNSRELNQAAKARINSYTTTAGVEYELLHTEIAVYYTNKNNRKTLQAFRDKRIHDVLIRSGIKRHVFATKNKGQEWFATDLETAKKAIEAVKNGKASLNPNDISEDNSPIIFRPEQTKAIKETLSQFKKGNRMLWNAKMRFGKTLSALEVAKEMESKKTLIFTHRPVVSDGWFEDFHKIFHNTDYVFGSKTKGEQIENLVDTDKPFVYFASIQDLRGSAAVGGKFDKNEFVFLIDWDYIIVDEAHEGTQTTLGQRVLDAVLSNSPSKQPKLLELSGTPFNLLSNFKKDEIYTWDYIMEQTAKRDWDLLNFGDSNPYAELPKLEIFTYNLDKHIKGYIDIEDGAFNFREFFRTWTGDIKKDFKPLPNNVKVGDFVNKNNVNAFLNLLTVKDANNNFPFSTEEYRSFYRHTLWMVPGVKEAKALSALMKEHPVFGNSQFFKIVNVAGDGDEEENYKDALKAVRSAIGKNPDDHYSITISCGRLTTGVTVPEWTAVLMLAGSFNTSAANYLQTIFRVQTPANVNGKMKERCSVFDFAPDRTLKMVAEAGQLSSVAGNVSNDRVLMGEFLNFCPVIAISGSSMTEYNVDNLLQQLKKAYTDRVVKNGFDDKYIYNDNLLKLDNIELEEFEKLKKIIGSTKQTEKTKNLDVNKQGFTNEEYEELGRIEKIPKKERTPEEIAFLEEKKQKRDNAQKAMSILRGISIRIPLLVYGAEVPTNQDITVDNFVDLIDDASWNEFMPQGVTKDIYKKFAKYYEQDVFVAAGRQIRNMALSADELAPTERVKKIAEIFSRFKNPDKETVLTPWRVVNMHMGDCLGGYNFYNQDYSEVIDEPRFVDKGSVTKDIFKNSNVKVLEINSKTGLYPLYVTYSVFRNKIDNIPSNDLTSESVWDIWKETIKENLFIICKTPMAKSITKRTLLGYKQGKVNAHSFDDLIMQLKNKPEQFRDKILRGSFWDRREKEMKFDAIVGNPPYHDEKGGTKNIDIWQYFVYLSANLSKYATLIHPGRWLVPKKQMESVKKELLSLGLVSFDYYPDASKLFNVVSIDGGVTITFFKKEYNGQIKYYNNGSYYGTYNENIKFLSDNFEEEIYLKLNPILFGGKTMTDRIVGNIGSLGGGEFGYKKLSHMDMLKTSADNLSNPLKIWANRGFGKGSRFSWNFIDKNILNDIPEKLLSSRKVMIDKKGHAITTGRGNIINNTPKIVDRLTIASGDVLFVIPENDNDYELKLIVSMFMTKTIRFLMSLTQKDLYVRGFENIPDYTYFINSLEGELFTDKYFYDKYEFSNELISHIEKSVSPK